MTKININSEQLKNEIAQLKSSKKNLESIFNNIKNDTDILKDYWETETSESVFASFEALYKDLEEIKEKYQTDIEFLEKTVNESYISKEEATNQMVNDSFA